MRQTFQVGMKPEKVDRVRKKNKIIKTEIKEEIPEDNHQSDYHPFSVTEEFMNFRDIKRSSSEISNDSGSSVDISALAEECIFEEVKFVDQCEFLEKPLSMKVHKSNTIFDLRYKEKLSDERELFEDNLPSSLYRSSPTFHLTFEEEFKIYELIVRKENLVDGIFQTFMELPNFHESWLQFLLSINSGTGSVYKGVCNKIVKLKRKHIISNFMNGGVIRQSLDMFDDYKHVDESVKAETFFFTMSVFRFCIW